MVAISTALLLMPSLAGCGMPSPVQGSSGGKPGAMHLGGDPASAQKEALRKAVADLRSLSGRVSYRELDPRDGKIHESAGTFKMDTRRRWIRGFVEKSDKPNATGAETLFLNDGKITVKVKVGPISLTRTFPLDDDQVKSFRGYRLDQTDFASMAQVILAEGAKVESLGSGELLGRKVDLLDVTPPGLPDVLRERFGLDPATHLPVARVALAPRGGTVPGFGAWLATSPVLGVAGVGEQGVFAAVLADERLNLDLPPGTWQI